MPPEVSEQLLNAIVGFVVITLLPIFAGLIRWYNNRVKEKTEEVDKLNKALNEEKSQHQATKNAKTIVDTELAIRLTELEQAKSANTVFQEQFKLQLAEMAEMREEFRSQRSTFNAQNEKTIEIQSQLERLGRERDKLQQVNNQQSIELNTRAQTIDALMKDKATLEKQIGTLLEMQEKSQKQIEDLLNVVKKIAEIQDVLEKLSPPVVIPDTGGGA